VIAENAWVSSCRGRARQQLAAAGCHRYEQSRGGFTMIEVFGVLILIGVLVSLLLPAVQASREAARRTSCSNNMLQLGLAVQLYHAAFDQLPVHLSGTDGSITPGQDNDRRLSAWVALLPFLGQRDLAEKIEQPLDRTWTSGTSMIEDDFYGPAKKRQTPKGPWVAGGPEPFEFNYLPWNVETPVLRCPSDPGIGMPALSRTNYAVCLGDGVVASDSGPMKEVKGVFVWDPKLAEQTEASMRGMFVPRMVTQMDDVTDGLSHTLMLGEIATGLGDQDIRTHPAAGPGANVLRDRPDWARQGELINAERPRFWENVSGTLIGSSMGWRRGHRWCDGMPLYSAFNTILPPNREIVLRADQDDCWGILPPSSRHQGGANVCFGDGAVRFISDSIDAGDDRQPTVYVGSLNAPGSKSPFGVWGAMGTRASGELSVHRYGPMIDGP
jgi:prepilin-type processing-associated H-X9-DG protein